MVKLNDIGYDAVRMVDRHYVPHRTTKLVINECTEISGLASAYRLGEDGLEAIANFMNSVTKSGVSKVPPKAEEIARRHSTVKEEKKARTPEPTLIFPSYCSEFNKTLFPSRVSD